MADPVVAPPLPAPVQKQNPIVDFLASKGFHSFYHAALSGAMGFVGTHAFAPSSSWYVGLLAGTLGGVVGWLNGGQ